MKEKLSLAAARRVALAAQGFAEPRPGAPPGRRQLNRAIARLGLLQIDSVNVAVRAHYMPLFSRLGSYDRGLLDAMAWRRPPTLFEYWAHEASLLPLEFWPLFRWRMQAAENFQGTYGRLAVFARERRDFIDEVFRRVAERPLAASDFDGQSGSGGWWGWSDAKHALEWLFWAGRISTYTRRASFERVYALPERAIPAATRALPVPDQAEAHRRLIMHAVRALGVAAAADLRDYFRLPVEGFKDRLGELVEAGDLVPVSVEGWSQQAYLDAAARFPRRVEARALLAPFDPLVWERSRAERLFDFRYRIEIYTPAEKRVYGYYVFPFLLGEHLVARVDLKADRAAGALLVQSAHAEPRAPADTAEALHAELRLMADWLGLERIEIVGAGDLAPALARLRPT